MTTPARSSTACPTDESGAILDNVRSLEPDVAGIVGKLTQGAVDAGFVYITDVVATDGALEAIDLPADLQPDVAYGAAVVDGADERRRARRRSSTACSTATARRPSPTPGSARRRRTERWADAARSPSCWSARSRSRSPS